MHKSLGVLITGIVLGLTEANAAAGVETAAQSGFGFVCSLAVKKKLFPLSYRGSWPTKDNPVECQVLGMEVICLMIEA